jgi:threonine/homoserine/homoserine lactone efflux protein
MLTASGAAFGYRATLPHLLGVSFGHAFQTSLVGLGLGLVFARYPLLHLALKWLGCAYLLYLGWKLLWAGRVGNAQASAPLSFMQAAAFQFVNPKAWVMALTTVTLFLPADAPLFAACLAIAVVLVLVNFPCITIWALFGSGMRHFLTSEGRRRAFNLLMSALLLATAFLMLN